MNISPSPPILAGFGDSLLTRLRNIYLIIPYNRKLPNLLILVTIFILWNSENEVINLEFS